MTIRVVTFNLRGGQLQSRMDCSSGLTSGQTPTFYTQTFMAEKVSTDIDDAKTELLASTDFQGQKPTITTLGIEEVSYVFSTYARASYQGTGLRNTDGTLVYSAEEEYVTQYIEEEDIGNL
jgi:hypothetical protein